MHLLWEIFTRQMDVLGVISHNRIYLKYAGSVCAGSTRLLPIVTFPTVASAAFVCVGGLSQPILKINYLSGSLLSCSQAQAALRLWLLRPLGFPGISGGRESQKTPGPQVLDKLHLSLTL